MSLSTPSKAITFSAGGIVNAIPTAPEDLDDEELAAYAEEYDLHLEDLPLDEIFSYSDLEDYDQPLDGHSQSSTGQPLHSAPPDVEMT